MVVFNWSLWTGLVFRVEAIGADAVGGIVIDKTRLAVVTVHSISGQLFDGSEVEGWRVFGGWEACREGPTWRLASGKGPNRRGG